MPATGTITETTERAPAVRRSANAAYLAWYCAVLCLGLGASAVLYATLDRFRDTPVNFYALGDDEVVVTRGLTRTQNGGLKLGFIEHYPPPVVALAGNHQFMFFGKEAFGPGATDHYFMNYWFEDLGLPELYDYVSYLDSLGKLPTRLLLVQITTPNNDNGDNIVTYNRELPEDLQYFGVIRERTTSITQVFAKAHAYARHLIVRAEKAFDYTTVIAAVTQLRQPRGASSRVVAAGSLDPGALDLRAAFVNDGSVAAAYYRDRALARDENELSEKERHLRYGDEHLIASYMRKIAAIGVARGIRVAFVIPPVFETDRPSTVNDIFSAALREAPELTVFDHRFMYRDRPEFFARYDHPSKRYFQQFVAELGDRGLLPPVSDSAPTASDVHTTLR